MSYRWRAAIALILVLTLPLRAIAAVAMPCCDPVVDASGPSMQLAMDRSSDERTMPSHHAGTQAGYDCCAIAMIALPVRPTIVAHYMPPRATPWRARPVARFVTDAPDRPPRASTLMV